MKPERITCQACEGSGEITFEVSYDPGYPSNDYGPAHYEKTIGCGDCESEGVVDLETHQDQTDRGGGDACRDFLIDWHLDYS